MKQNGGEFKQEIVFLVFYCVDLLTVNSCVYLRELWWTPLKLKGSL